MKDEMLFVVAPALSVFACVVSALMCRVVRRGSEGPGPVSAPVAARDRVPGWWSVPIGIVLLGHVVAITAPGVVLAWNRDPFRLIVVESAGFTAGTVALWCLIAGCVRCLRSPDSRARYSCYEGVPAGLLFLAIVTGLAVALRYRWASSWAAVTLTPYLRSLLALRPEVALIGGMPFSVKLHVFCAFALLALAPLSRTIRAMLAPVETVARLTATAGAKKR